VRTNHQDRIFGFLPLTQETRHAFLERFITLSTFLLVELGRNLYRFPLLIRNRLHRFDTAKFRAAQNAARNAGIPTLEKLRKLFRLRPALLAQAVIDRAAFGFVPVGMTNDEKRFN